MTYNSLDSAFDSQKYLSQSNNNSQMSTQDLFTSNSQNEKSTEKMSMYEKWLSKRSLFKQSTPRENKGSSWPSCSSQPQASQLRCGSNKPDYSYNSQNEVDMRINMQRITKSKAAERDERDLLEQIVNALKENNNEIQVFARDLRDEFEKLGELSREENKQMLTMFMEKAEKCQDNILSSVKVKEQTSSEMDNFKEVIKKKDAEILTLQLKLQASENRRKDEMTGSANTVIEQLRLPQEKLALKLEEISERMNKVNHNLNVYKESIETEMQQSQSLFENTPTDIKEMEKRLMKELKTFQTDMMASLNVKEILEGCFEHWLVDIQDLSQHKLDSFSKKTKSDMKDLMNLELKKSVDICLRKHLKTVCNQLEEISQLHKEGQVVQGSYFQATVDESLEKIKFIVESCKTNFEEETSLLKMLDHRLKQLIDNVSNNTGFHGCYSGMSVEQPLRLPSLTNNIAYSSVLNPGHNTSNFNRTRNDGDNYNHMDFSSGTSGNGFPTPFNQNLPKSSTFDLTYKMNQYKSYSTQNEFSKDPSLEEKFHLSQQKGISNHFVETKKAILTSNPELSIISPFRRPDDVRINPSPVATVKPQRRDVQAKCSYSGQTNKEKSLLRSPYQQCKKYDLRKRKMIEVSRNFKTNKEPKLDHQDKNITLGGSKRKINDSYNSNHEAWGRWYHQRNEQCCNGQIHKGPLQMEIKDIKGVTENHHQNFHRPTVNGDKGEKNPKSLPGIRKSKGQAINEHEEEMHSQFEIASGRSSPACSVYSIRIKTPLRQISSVQASRRRGFFHQGKPASIMNLSRGTLLSDM